MTDKISLIESIINENAVDFRQIVNKVLLEKLAVRLDNEYKNTATSMFTLSEAEQTEEEVEQEEGEEENEQPEVSEEAPEATENTGNRAARSYGAY
jgi:hypothetical protein